MRKDYIYNVLKERGYDSHSAELVVEELTKLEKPLNDYLECWLHDESDKKDFVANGYSISQLQSERQMSYPAALLTIDWLIKEPASAIESLKRGIR